MSILITSDIHLSENPRDAYRHTFMRQLPEVVARHKADAVFVLGDLTESKGSHNAELVNATVEHFYNLAQVCPVVILQGNHDWLSSPENPYFQFLHLIEGITWISKPTPANHAHSAWPEKLPKLPGPTMFLPHTNNPSITWQKLNFDHYDFIFTHQTFAGALGDNGKELGGASTELFPDSARIISGDVHVPQQVGQVTYVGAPYHVDFGDSFDGRLLLIADDGNIQSIPYKGPQKHLVNIQSIAGLDGRKFLPDDVLKVRLETTLDQYAHWSELVSKVYAWGDRHKYAIHSVQPCIVQTANKTTKQQTAQPTKTDKELMVEYAAARSVDVSTVKAGLNLL
jgi:hypothetical protein